MRGTRSDTGDKFFSPAQINGVAWGCASVAADIAIRCWPYAGERLVGQRDARFSRRNRSVNRLGDPHALALAVRRLAGSCALLSLGFLFGRASPSSGLMAALAPCPGWPAMAAVVAGAGGEGVTGASVAIDAGDAAGTTCQRASSSDRIVGLGGTSSSIATGTSGSVGFSLAAATGCGGGSTRVAGRVVGLGPAVSAVTVGPNESAVTAREAPTANNNANASHMMVCFIVASRSQSHKKSAVSPCLGSTAPDSFKINSGRLEAD